MTASPEQVERLLDWTARLRESAAAMPWAEPPPQPGWYEAWFDRYDAAEAEEFARMMAAREPGPRNLAVRENFEARP